MTINQARAWAKENGIGEESVINRIREVCKKTRSSWQSITLKIGEKDGYQCTPYGYRKFSDHSYVSNSYRSHFGWKNTYYQNAITKITFAKEQPK